MPRLDGIEAARRILDERPIPIVMVTAYGERELVARAVEAGVFGYLVKPFRETDLLPAIETARARHEELAALRAEAESLADALAARKAIERAKGLLMEKEGLSEQDAFARLRKASQVSGRPLKVVAEAVVATLETVSEHPHAAAARHGFERFVGGDVAALLGLFAPDAVWHVPGENAMSGDYRGRDEIVAFLRRTAELTGGYLPRATLPSGLRCETTAGPGIELPLFADAPRLDGRARGARQTSRRCCSSELERRRCWTGFAAQPLRRSAAFDPSGRSASA